MSWYEVTKCPKEENRRVRFSRRQGYTSSGVRSRGSQCSRCPVERAWCVGQGVSGANRKHAMTSRSETRTAKIAETWTQLFLNFNWAHETEGSVTQHITWSRFVSDSSAGKKSDAMSVLWFSKCCEGSLPSGTWRRRVSCTFTNTSKERISLCLWLFVWLILRHWRRRQYFSTKHRLTSTELHGVTYQETVSFTGGNFAFARIIPRPRIHYLWNVWTQNSSLHKLSLWDFRSLTSDKSWHSYTHWLRCFRDSGNMRPETIVPTILPSVRKYTHLLWVKEHFLCFVIWNINTK